MYEHHREAILKEDKLVSVAVAPKNATMEGLSADRHTTALSGAKGK